MGSESMHPTTLELPSLVMAYRIFLNGVDRFDQMRASHGPERKEGRVPMYIFKFLHKASVINAHEL